MHPAPSVIIFTTFSGLGFGLLFILFQIRHYMTSGNIYTESFSFDEIGLYVSTGLVMAIARHHVWNSEKKRDYILENSIIGYILSGLSWLTLGLFILGLCLIYAPLLNQNTIVKGSLLANSLTLGYFIPVLLMGVLLWMERQRESEPYLMAMRVIAIIGAMLFITSQIRYIFSGSDMSIFTNFPEGLETYVISASWLFIGVAALAAGIKLDRPALRIGSGIIVILTVLKAFLIDMSTLEGVLRAISFVILGLVLIMIGRVYQRLLFEEQT